MCRCVGQTNTNHHHGGIIIAILITESAGVREQPDLNGEGEGMMETHQQGVRRSQQQRRCIM